MCGYEGRGVWASDVTTVAEYCCHCRARTYQSQEGICELCGKDAEGADTPTPADAAPCPTSDRDHPAPPSEADPQGDATGLVPGGAG